MDLSKKIEAILFFKGEAVSVKQLMGFLNVSGEEIREAMSVLKDDLQSRGIRLVINEDKAMLGTAPEMHKIIENLRKEELSKDLGKASLETLSIVLYRGPVRKSEIDYIRGVNSASILRNLLVRGLVERKSDSKNRRSFLYVPTFELLSFLGVSELSELPEYEKIREEIKKNENKIEDSENSRDIN